MYLRISYGMKLQLFRTAHGSLASAAAAVLKHFLYAPQKFHILPLYPDVGGFGFAGRVGYGQLDEAAFIQEIFF